MVEGVRKVGVEVKSELVEVEEMVMVMREKVMCNKVGRLFVNMIGHSVTPF